MRITTCVFCVLLYAWPALGAEMAKTDPENTLVLVTSSTYLGKKAGNGFVIGDGTLVVTAYHIVFEESEQGQHTMGGLVRVLSPYLGQGREAYIIAADRDLDLAVLKVNWQGHPALRQGAGVCQRRRSAQRFDGGTIPGV